MLRQNPFPVTDHDQLRPKRERVLPMNASTIKLNDPVDVIIATRDRVELLRKAIDAVLAQSYAGDVRITVVYDQNPPNHDLELKSGTREVRVMSNTRAPGLPGSRNTGLLTATSPLVAFCDDDDAWRPNKLDRQVAQMSASGALGTVGGIEVHYGDVARIRQPGVSEITVADLAGSRLTGAHPSTYMFDRQRLLETVGVVDEILPYGYGEDYDLLLRAARQGRVLVDSEVLADILWHRGGSYFSQKWEAMSDGLEYLMIKHPVITENRRGNAWMEGQRAFALAAQGNKRRAAVQTAIKSLRLSLAEPRGYLALAVAAKIVRPQFVVDTLNAKGRGI